MLLIADCLLTDADSSSDRRGLPELSSSLNRTSNGFSIKMKAISAILYDRMNVEQNVET